MARRGVRLAWGTMIRSLLIANRGEIALRILRTARERGIRVVTVFSPPDRNALHVRLADSAHPLPGSSPSESYLRGDLLLEIARETGAEAIHPGYGFLAENADFARAVEEAGRIFIGPGPEAILKMGDKIAARRAAEEAGVPTIPGADAELDPEVLLGRAEEIGFPVLLKAAAGGGGKGIRRVDRAEDFREALKLATDEAGGAFGDGRVYLEKFLVKPRHVEVQVLADNHGNTIALGERECSVQRRHQKLVEESPSPAIDEDTRERMCEAAVRLAAAVDYRGAGTVEFMFSEGEFYFLEMNTRLQVEHAITEERFGVDLVFEQIRVASGLEIRPPSRPRGHAIEVRINAEDPDTFFPSLGTVERLASPGGPGVRFDSALFRGLEVGPWYDSMLAKVITWAPTRDEAIAKMRRALEELRITGVRTSVPAALRALDSEAFRAGDYDTSLLDDLPRAFERRDFDLAALAAALASHRRLLGSGEKGLEDGTARGRPTPWMLGRGPWEGGEGL